MYVFFGKSLFVEADKVKVSLLGMEGSGCTFNYWVSVDCLSLMQTQDMPYSGLIPVSLFRLVMKKVSLESCKFIYFNFIIVVSQYLKYFDLVIEYILIDCSW